MSESPSPASVRSGHPGEGTITGADVQSSEQADDERGRSTVLRLRAWFEQTYLGACVERTLELRPFDRGLALASRAFVALLPLAIVMSALSPAARNGGFAGGLIDRFQLDGKGAQAVRELFATPSEVKGGVTAFGILVMLYSVYSFARLLARTYEAAWHLPKAGVGGAARGILWVLELALYVALLAPLRRFVDDNAGNVVADVVALSLATLVWLVTPYLLLAGRVPYRALLPTALLTAASLGIASAFSIIYMPNAITTSAARYGLVGVAFTFVSWLIGIGIVVVIAAAIGAVTAERYLQQPKGA
jgi:membrane protein